MMWGIWSVYLVLSSLLVLAVCLSFAEGGEGTSVGGHYWLLCSVEESVLTIGWNCTSSLCTFAIFKSTINSSTTKHSATIHSQWFYDLHTTWASHLCVTIDTPILEYLWCNVVYCCNFHNFYVCVYIFAMLSSNHLYWVIYWVVYPTHLFALAIYAWHLYFLLKALVVYYFVLG